VNRTGSTGSSSDLIRSSVASSSAPVERVDTLRTRRTGPFAPFEPFEPDEPAHPLSRGRYQCLPVDDDAQR